MTQTLIYWVYILHCKNDSYYTGYTTDVARRYQEHLNGSYKCKFTRSFKPLKIAQCWEVVGDKSCALKVEKFIQRMSKKEKSHLVAHPDQLKVLLPFEVHKIEKANLI